METTIIIKGQISGNHRLLNALRTIDSKEERMRFNSYKIMYPTKKQAKEAIDNAYKTLKEDEPDYYKDGGINSVKGLSISYDASIAYIISE